MSERVYQQLKWPLIVGEFAPDAKLSIRKVAEAFGTSAMPVREALKRLATERALVSRANRLFRVPRLAPKRVSELFFLRANLEGPRGGTCRSQSDETAVQEAQQTCTADREGCRFGRPARLSHEQLPFPFYDLQQRR